MIRQVKRETKLIKIGKHYELLKSFKSQFLGKVLIFINDSFMRRLGLITRGFRNI